MVSEVKLPVRLAPPSLQILSNFHYVNQGGSEAVVYRVGEGAIRDGVQAGSWWFPGFPVPGNNDKQVRFAFFAVPYDMSDASQVLPGGRSTRWATGPRPASSTSSPRGRSRPTRSRSTTSS